MSEYNGDVSSILTRSRRSCFDICQNPEILSEGFQVYDALNEFMIWKITFHGTILLDSQITENILTHLVSLPQLITDGNLNLIAYGPDVCSGYDGDCLVLVCISVYHGSVSYQWMKDGVINVEASGNHKCILVVDAPGNFCCVVSKCAEPEIYELSKTVSVVATEEGFQVVQQGNSQIFDAGDQVLHNTYQVLSDAGQVSPDTGHVLPDTGRVLPDTGRVLPDAGKILPEAGPVLADPGTILPNVDQALPDAAQFLHDAAPVLPVIYLEKIPRGSISFTANDEIGRGSFGIVYRARWAATPVAVKQILFKRRNRGMDLAIQKELSIHCRARHPNIVQLMGMSTDDHYLYIISELVDGQNLEDVLFTNATIQLQQSDKILIANNCSSALCYLHNLHPLIIHQDVKPANVIVTHNTRVAKLCDFGLSRVKTMQTVATAVGVQGTAFYLPPECLIEGKPGSIAADIWSLGCTLIELFTGIELWKFDDDDVDIFACVTSALKRNIPPHAICKLSAEEKYTQVLKDCLNFNPQCRPTAMEVFGYFV